MSLLISMRRARSCSASAGPSADRFSGSAAGRKSGSWFAQEVSLIASEVTDALVDLLRWPRRTKFRSDDTAHQPVIDALKRYAKAGNTTYYPLGETTPEHKGMLKDWADLVYRTDTRGRRSRRA
ncbi:hypothetical protein ABZ912_26985 [Nonomuraea angiospora]|uniref:hypothetical protein n=1 Tax=Nonomuraea angiospora TaxID=46172 RepID=UPI0033CF300E